MKKVRTVSLEIVKTILRRGEGGRVENYGGWSVFVDLKGEHFYVMDDCDSNPVAYRKIGPISSTRSKVVNNSFVISS